MPSFSSPPNPKAFQIAVWEIVRQVASGKVTTYGQIAALIPPPGKLNFKDYQAYSARWVGGAMAACPDDVTLAACHQFSGQNQSPSRGSQAASTSGRRRR